MTFMWSQYRVEPSLTPPAAAFACEALSERAGTNSRVRLATRHVDAHLDEMANKLSVRLLDVDVTALQPTLWKWTISEKNFEVSHGYATSRETAQTEGNNALFALLSIVPD